MDPLYAEVLDRAATIAKTIGGIDYMNDRAKDIGVLLAEMSELPREVSVREPDRGIVVYDVRRWNVKPGTRRYVNATKLKARFPHAHRAVVESSDPDRVYQVRLDSTRGGRKSEEWAVLKQAGALGREAGLRERFRDTPWNPGSYLRALHLLRSEVKLSEERLTALRDGLIGFVVEHELPLVVPGRDDGRVVLRENGPRITIDYDRLERDFPQAATLISRSPTPGGARILLKEQAPDPDDEEETLGIWK